jgi:hypothetical protein
LLEIGNRVSRILVRVLFFGKRNFTMRDGLLRTRLKEMVKLFGPTRPFLKER